MAGTRWIHVVDLDANPFGKSAPTIADVIATIASRLQVPIELGGGIRDRTRAELLLSTGIDRVVLGTAALEDPDFARGLAADHPGRVVIGLDHRRSALAGLETRVVAVRGWEKTTGLDLEAAIALYEGAPIGALIITDITADGTLAGPDLAGYQLALSLTSSPIIASGGIGTLAHLEALAVLEHQGRGLAGVVILIVSAVRAESDDLEGGNARHALVIQVIPCLDVDHGRVVKGVNFLGLKDAGDPVELARGYDRAGADEVVFLDITASSDERAILLDVVTRTAEEIYIPLTVGGGVRSLDDARTLLRAGADKVAVNSAALARPALISEIAQTFGSQCVVVAIDARRRASGGYGVFSHGGRQETGLDAISWATAAEELGAGEILLTSMDRDGTELGYDLELLGQVIGATGIPIVASGGVGTLEHLVLGAQAGADAVLAASIFHYGQYSIAQAKDELARAQVLVRPIDPDNDLIEHHQVLKAVPFKHDVGQRDREQCRLLDMASSRSRCSPTVCSWPCLLLRVSAVRDRGS